MDINDRKRRLQVYSASNPSLRVASQPQQKLQVTTRQEPQRLFVGNQQIKQSENAQVEAPSYTPQQDPRTNLSRLVDAVNPNDDNRDWNNPGQQKAPNFFQRNASPTGLFNIGKEVVQGVARTPIELGQTISQNFRDVDSNEHGQGDAPYKSWNPSGWQKRLFGDKVQSYQQQGDELSETVKDAEKIGFVENPLQGKELGKRNLAALGFATSLIPGLFSGGKKAGVDALVKSADNTAVQIAQSGDAATIGSIIKQGAPHLEDEVAKTTAEVLAHETNPEVIQTILESVQGPQLSPGVYTAYSPHPDSIPEGTVPPRQPGTPNEFRPLTPEELEAQRAENEASVRFSEAGQNAADVVKQPGKVAQAVVRGADPEVTDPLNTLVTSMAKSPNKREVGAMIDGLFPGIPNELRTPMMKEITKAQTEDDVLEAIVKHVTGKPLADESPTEAIAKAADEVTPTPVETPNQQAEAIVAEAAPMQTGTSLAPNEAGSVPAPAGDITGQAGGLGDTVNADLEALRGSDPELDAAIEQVKSGLSAANKSNNSLEAIRAREKAARLYKGEAAFDAAGGGEQGFRAKLGSLKGEYSKSGYEPIAVDEEVQTRFINDIEKSGLQKFEKINTQNALRKIWGANPEKPVPSDVRYVKDFFNKHYGEGVGDEVAELVTEAVKTDKGWGEIAANIAGLPRALMATGDLSGGLRQAAPLGSRHPILWAKANVESVKYALRPKYYEQEMKKLTDSPEYNVVTDQMGVDLPGAGATMDEAFIGADYAEKIPVYGKVVIKPAERAYAGVLTKLRYDVAKKAVDAAGGPENYVKAMDDLYGPEAKTASRAYGEVINTLTGRGGKKGGALDTHMKTLSTVLFAPRLWAANVQRLNPVWYAKKYKANPEAGKLAMQSQVTFLTMAGTVLGLASASGAEVGVDPRSADFGKIKLGNTRYDILGGQQQNIVQLARQVTGQKVDSQTGEVDTLGDGFGASNRFDLAIDMLQNKSNPLLGFAARLMQTADDPDSESALARQDKYGQEFNIAKETGKLGVPLGVQGAADIAEDTGSKKEGFFKNIPSFFGVGVQTYGNTKTKDQGETKADGTKEFKGKVTDDMILDDNGKPYLDDKGKPVKVKFEKDATDLEKQAIKDDKIKGLKANAWKDGLSREDQALMKLEDKQLKKYRDEGKISGTKYEEIKDNKKRVDNLDGVDIPEEVTTPAVKEFYKKYNSMDEEDRKKWLKEPADDNAKFIATELNKQRSEGLREYKPSNELSKAYSEFEKDMNSHEYNEVDKRNKTREFQKFAYKLNFSDKVKDVYNEGGSADVKYLLSEKQISKEELDEAISLDNELYNSGLTGTLKFSKKFRGEHGYSLPAKGGDGTGGSSGGGGSRGGRGGRSGGTNKVGLTGLMPSFSKGDEAPVVSSKARTGMKVGGFTPKTGSTKKIRINL